MSMYVVVVTCARNNENKNKSMWNMAFERPPQRHIDMEISFKPHNTLSSSSVESHCGCLRCALIKVKIYKCGEKLRMTLCGVASARYSMHAFAVPLIAAGALFPDTTALMPVLHILLFYYLFHVAHFHGNHWQNSSSQLSGLVDNTHPNIKLTKKTFLFSVAVSFVRH